MAMQQQQHGNQQRNDQQRPRGFTPNEHLIQLKGKDYLPVCWRLVWFRERFPQGSIETEMLHLDPDRETEEEAMAWNPEKRRSEKVLKQARGFVIFRATVKDGLGGIATGTKSEKAASFPDYVEKAETGAIGRALAALGYGTQFTGDEFEEEHRIADSPVDRGQSSSHAQESAPPQAEQSGKSHPSNPTPAADQKATPQQVESVRKLYLHLGEEVPEELEKLSALEARKLIQRLSALYSEKKAEKKKQDAPPTTPEEPPIEQTEEEFSPPSKEKAPTIAELRAEWTALAPRTSSGPLDFSWAVKKVCGGKVIADDAIDPTQAELIQAEIDTIKRNRAEAEQKTPVGAKK
ncbi:MAG: hypothetical protein J2P36_23155 [Ktedonobacteraceae bacterium]|nr:hypothetical protein [Ktedonobacteraceae bacterium]